ncbi:MAG: acyl carrier protein, partial [Bacteroidetes bacterium]
MTLDDVLQQVTEIFREVLDDEELVLQPETTAA